MFSWRVLKFVGVQDGYMCVLEGTKLYWGIPLYSLKNAFFTWSSLLPVCWKPLMPASWNHYNFVCTYQGFQLIFMLARQAH